MRSATAASSACIARQRRLELLGVKPSTVRALAQADVTTVDRLAELNLTSSSAAAIRQTEGFDVNLAQLQAKAQARRATLPRENGDPKEFEVRPIPKTGKGQLPEHAQDGRRLVRVYLAVDYDYAENRIGALSAHVTASDHELRTPFDPDTKKRRRASRRSKSPRASMTCRTRLSPGRSASAPETLCTFRASRGRES